MTFLFNSRTVNIQEREVASAMMGGFIGLGIAVGSALSLVLVKAL